MNNSNFEIKFYGIEGKATLFYDVEKEIYAINIAEASWSEDEETTENEKCNVNIQKMSKCHGIELEKHFPWVKTLSNGSVKQFKNDDGSMEVDTICSHVTNSYSVGIFGEASGYAIVSKRVTEEGKNIGYAYHEEVTRKEDSGWIFFVGDEDEEYCDNPKNFEIVSLRSLLAMITEENKEEE